MLDKEEILKRSKKLKPNTNGIYFLIQNKEIVYVGCSTSSCENRILYHRRSGIKFNSFYILEVISNNLFALEKEFIIKLRPRYNKSQNPDYYDKMGKELTSKTKHIFY